MVLIVVDAPRDTCLLEVRVLPAETKEAVRDRACRPARRVWPGIAGWAFRFLQDMLP